MESYVVSESSANNIGEGIQYGSVPTKQASVKRYTNTKVKEEFIVSDAIASESGVQFGGSKNYPQKKYRAGAISATVWSNSFQNEKGSGSYNTVSLERIYQDKEGNWKSTNSLRLNDLPKVAAVMQRAYEDLIIKEQELFKAEVSV
ncbi:hypothetical protein HOC01_02635 [archaeon]|jgi:hypothetical protein|nr:hypothetical protein [archaeon]MBT6697783.1 hypothetical protein [archaeon]